MPTIATHDCNTSTPHDAENAYVKSASTSREHQGLIGNSVDYISAFADALTRIATTETDLLGDLVDPSSVDAALALAADIWEDVHGTIVPHAVMVAARTKIAKLRHDLLAQRDRDAALAHADAVEAGDEDQDGNPIPYGRSY